jgi:tetratricopeptide (TPR) repeat protein
MDTDGIKIPIVSLAFIKFFAFKPRTANNRFINQISAMSLHNLTPYLLLITAVFAAYANVFGNAFLFDDQMLIVENEFLRHWSSWPLVFTTPVMAGSHTSSDFYRPLQTVLYLIIYQLGGLSTFGFHLLNVALHAANACLVYTLGRRMKFDARAVFFAALIWALHPIHTEAVTYMSGTADLLYSFFCLLGLNILLPDFAPRKFLAASLFMMLGLLSKETAVVFPALATVCLFALSKDRLILKTYARTWPLWVMAGFYLFIRFGFLSFNPQEFVNLHPELTDYGTHITLRITTFLATIPAYLGVLLWPEGLHMERQFPVVADWLAPQALTGTVLLAAVFFLIIRTAKNPHYSPLGWGLLWVMAAHFPQTGILIPINALFLEHWMYLPSVGLALGGAQALQNHLIRREPRRIAAMLAVTLAVVLASLTFCQNKIWHDGVVFYKNILGHGEVSVRAHNNLGIAYSDRGDYPHALEQFNLALKLGDFYPETHQNIAAAYSKMPEGGPKMIPQEIAELKRALELNPDYLLANDNLAHVYAYLGDAKNAAYYRERAAEIRRKYEAPLTP